MPTFIPILPIAVGVHAPAPNPSRVYPCEVRAVHDGDTVTVVVPEWPALFSPITVRLAGIDCPELRDPRPEIKAIAEKAAVRLRELLAGKQTELCSVRRDKYFRLLATLTAFDKETNAWRSVAPFLLVDGLARPYTGRGPKPW